MTQRCYYEVLEVSRTATEAELKSAFRKAAMLHHPDRNPGNAEAERRFKECNEAYSVLTDPQKRAAYDRVGHAAFAPGGGGARSGGGGGGFHDPRDIFETVFGSGGGIFDSFFGNGARQAEQAGRGNDLRYDLEIDFEEAARGSEKEVAFNVLDTCQECSGRGGMAGSRDETCPTCHGRGQVAHSRGFFTVASTCPRCNGAGRVVTNPCRKCGGEGRTQQRRKVKVRIPAGIDNGSRLRSSGHGEAGVRGGPHGDLHIIGHVRDHEIFVRQDDDLLCEVPVQFTIAALGGEIEVPTLRGSARLKIPAGTQYGTMFRLRGQGMPNVHGHGTGDLLVRVQVEVPSKLSRPLRDKLEEFAGLANDEAYPLRKSFLDKAKRFFGAR